MSSLTQTPESPSASSQQQKPGGTPSSSSKARKPYTITKQRENWTDEEHQKFLDALNLFGRDWKKIETFVGTKTVIQIRSHAQKYFLKVQKNNTGDRIPPPRPKRKSVTPDSDMVTVPWATTSDSVTASPFVNTPFAFANWMLANSLVQEIEPPRQEQEQLTQAQQSLQQAIAQTQLLRTPSATSNQGPNFNKIYSFLGSLFDPLAANYTEAMNELTNTDRETLQLLMNNLTVNHSNPQLREQHTALIDQHRALLTAKGTTDSSALPPELNSSLDGEDVFSPFEEDNTPKQSS